MTERTATDTRPTSVERAADLLLFDTARHGGPWSAVLVVTAFCVTAVRTVFPALLGKALDDALSGTNGGWVAVCGATVLVLASGEVVAALAGETSVANGTAWLRHSLLGHLLALRGRGGSRFTEGDLVSRLVAGAGEAGEVVSAAVWAVLSLVPTGGSVVALWLIDPWLGVTFLLALPLFVALLRVFTRDFSDVTVRYQRTQGELSESLVDALGGMRTIAAAGTVERECARVLRPLPELNRLGHRMWRTQARALAHGSALVPLLEVAVLSVAGFGLADGRVSVGEMLAAAQYVFLGAGIGVVSMQFARLARARGGARRAREVLGEPAVRYGHETLPEDGAGDLELRGVAVAGGERLLDGIDVTVRGGSCVAVVGRSGTGKSLLAALVGRLADPDEGTVLLDGVPLSRLSRAALRDAVSYAFERPVLLGDTLADAIGLGAGHLAEERVHWAAHAASADTFVRRLPGGYGTPVDRAPMSGGEVQRIGLARAFVRPARVLVLDDATSSLDTVTEHQVSTALTGVMGRRTRLVVAHRASTAARADRVVWLDEGRVRAEGPHHELWRDPAYRRLFQADSEEGTG